MPKAEHAKSFEWLKQMVQDAIKSELEKMGIPRLKAFGVIKSITVTGTSGGLSVADVYLNGATTAVTNIPVNPDIAPYLSVGDPVWVERINFDSRDMFVSSRHNGTNAIGGSGNTGSVKVLDNNNNTIVTIDNNGIKMYDTNGLLRFWSVPNNSGGGSSMGTTEAFGALYGQSTTNFGTSNTNFFGAVTNDQVVVLGATPNGKVFSHNNTFDDGTTGKLYAKDSVFVNGNYAAVTLNGGYEYHQSGIVSLTWTLDGTAGPGSVHVTFPTAFNAAANVRVLVSIMSNTDPMNWEQPIVANQSPTGFDIYQKVPASSTVSSFSYAYHAIGYL